MFLEVDKVPEDPFAVSALEWLLTGRRRTMQVASRRRRILMGGHHVLFERRLIQEGATAHLALGLRVLWLQGEANSGN